MRIGGINTVGTSTRGMETVLEEKEVFKCLMLIGTFWEKTQSSPKIGGRHSFRDVESFSH